MANCKFTFLYALAYESDDKIVAVPVNSDALRGPDAFCDKVNTYRLFVVDRSRPAKKNT